MSSRVIIPRESPLYTTLERLASDQRVVLFAGLPGTGKSLLVQQLALMAHGVGRPVHLLQWDVARAPFETAELLGRYPEREGVTHPAIRRAVGLWARGAVLRWHADHPDRAHLLLGEVPLLGERLSTLAEVLPDAAEPLLAGPATQFVIPVPSGAVRRHIEATRERTFATPAHEREAADAPPQVLRALWRELHDLGVGLGIAAAAPAGDIPYDQAVYAAMYQHLLRHRRHETLRLDEILSIGGSVYDLDVATGELAATPEEVTTTMRRVERAAH